MENLTAVDARALTDAATEKTVSEILTEVNDAATLGAESLNLDRMVSSTVKDTLTSKGFTVYCATGFTRIVW